MAEDVATRLANLLCKKKSVKLARQLPQFKVSEHTVRGFKDNSIEKCVFNFQRKQPFFDCKEYCRETIDFMADMAAQVNEERSDAYYKELEAECRAECTEGLDSSIEYVVGGMVMDSRSENALEVSIPGKCITWGVDDIENLLGFREKLAEIGCEPNISEDGAFEGEWKHPHDWIPEEIFAEFPGGHEALREWENPAVCFYHIKNIEGKKCNFVELLSLLDKEI